MWPTDVRADQRAYIGQLLQRALILFIQTLTLYKSFTYLLTTDTRTPFRVYYSTFRTCFTYCLEAPSSSWTWRGSLSQFPAPSPSLPPLLPLPRPSHAGCEDERRTVADGQPRSGVEDITAKDISQRTTRSTHAALEFSPVGPFKPGEDL